MSGLRVNARPARSSPFTIAATAASHGTPELLSELAFDEVYELAGADEGIQLDARATMVIVAQQKIDFRFGRAIPLQGLADRVRLRLAKAWVGRTLVMFQERR